MRDIVFAAHGILTRQTTASWPDHLNAHLVNDCAVVTKEYVAGPVPMWNCWVKNNWLASGLTAEAMAFSPEHRLHFVAHSNGCDVVLKTIKKLAKRGRPVATVILIGSVTQPDLVESGVADLLRDGHLANAFAYCSPIDRALAIHVKWPYSNLGRKGWYLNRTSIGRVNIGPGVAVTRWFKTYGHSGYWAKENILSTFAQIVADCRIPA